MPGWSSHTGSLVHLPRDNVDTDQLIPARFMSAPRDAGYGGFLLHDVRRDAQGGQDADFPLNRHPGASILIAGRNFGSGSSREAAVYALVDAGFRAVIAPSFGDIFAGNAVNNGLLPARVAAVPEQFAEGAEARVDLDTCAITCGADTLSFDLDPTWRLKLMRGWDDIDLTRTHADAVAAFRRARRAVPGVWPGHSAM